MQHKPILSDPFSKSRKLFFKVPMDFQMHQSSMTQSEKDIYIFFMIQIKYKKKLEIECSVENISYWTGIKSIATINNGIRGLVEKGWISDITYQMQKPNIYKINLGREEPNKELIQKIINRKENTSRAKKQSIANGESGKFTKKKMPQES